MTTKTKVEPNRGRQLAYRLFKSFRDRIMQQKRFHPERLDLNVLKCEIAYNKFGGYCIPRSSAHRPAAKTVRMGGVYEPNTIDYMRENCGDGDIVHAGTYFGDFLPALSNAAAPQAKIWAFEPNSENHRCAKITIELNSLPNIILNHAGLGEQSQSLFVQTTDEKGQSLGGGSRIVTSTHDESAQVVKIVTIDETLPSDRRVALIQLDVEGFEQQACAGGMRTIRQWRPTLILEALPGVEFEKSEWFATNILNLGYRRITKLHENLVYACSS